STSYMPLSISAPADSSSVARAEGRNWLKKRSSAARWRAKVRLRVRAVKIHEPLPDCGKASSHRKISPKAGQVRHRKARATASASDSSSTPPSEGAVVSEIMG